MRRFHGPAGVLLLACGCQTLFGDFTVAPETGEEPSSVLGTECEPGDFRCANDVLETCSDDRAGWVAVETCASPAECNLNSRSCRPCALGERMCRDNRLEYCDGAAEWQLDVECATAALCSVVPDRTSGSCATPACDEAGAHYCEDSMLVRCSPGRDRVEAVALCENPELCDAAFANDLAAAGLRGACRAPACAPDAFSCDGATLRHCSRDRTAWENVTVCDSADLCNASSGACTACAPGQVECNGAELRRCTDAGTWQTLATCAGAELCDAHTGKCLSAECDEPGKLRCGAGGIPALEACSSDLGWEALDVCATVALCSVSAGRCLAPACDGDETRCVGSRLERCSRDRTRWELDVECAVGEICEADVGCVAGPCTEGEMRCNGASLERCTLGVFHEERRCATPILCKAETSSCSEPACTAGPALECNGSIIRKCREGRDDFDDVRTCLSGTTCEALGTGVAECVRCTPDAFECDGNDLLRCSSDGQVKERVSSCPTSCVVSAGEPACG